MNTNLGTMKKIKNHQLSFCRNWCGQILCQSPECSEDFFFKTTARDHSTLPDLRDLGVLYEARQLSRKI